MRLRAVQPAVFGLVALCFLLPFAEVACAPTDTPSVLSGPLEDGALVFDVTGVELVTGKSLSTETKEIAEEFELDEDAFRYAAEPFAVLALGAALAGLVLSVAGPRGRRAVCGVACGAAGIVALGVLALAPTTRAFGGFTVTWLLGYYACLVAFAAATAVSWLARREDGLPGPAPPRPPPRGVT